MLGICLKDHINQILHFLPFLLYFFNHFFLEKRIHDKSEGNVLEITETKKTKQRKTKETEKKRYGQFVL